MQYIDIFSGCGGLAYGLHSAGWNSLFAIEKSNDAFSTLKHNIFAKKDNNSWPEWLDVAPHDINELLKNNRTELKKLAGKIALVAGGPPCQGFSTAGKRQADDVRNQLVSSYIDFVSMVKPELIFFENVKGFTLKFDKNGNRVSYLDIAVSSLNKIGYNVHGQLIDFSEFGVPQKRKRFIMVGTKNTNINPDSFFKKLYENREAFLKSKGISQNISIFDAISDLHKENGTITCPDSSNFSSGVYSKTMNDFQRLMRGKKYKAGQVADSHRFPKHSSEVMRRFSSMICGVSDNMGTKKRNQYVLCANTPSPTLTTLPDDYIHYSEPRILTPREYARIQTFPDSFEFKGKYTTGGWRRKLETPRYTQIGNAIPPLFAEQAGIALAQLLK